MIRIQAKRGLHVAAALLCASTLGACGVKGKPQPPLTPAELGHGQPAFRRSSDEFVFPNVPSPDATPEPKKTPGSAEKL